MTERMPYRLPLDLPRELHLQVQFLALSARLRSVLVREFR